MDDVDWDDLLPGGDDTSDLQLVAVAVGQGRQALLPPPLALAIRHVPVKSQRKAVPAKSQWTVQIPSTPSKRSFEQSCLAASRMRDSRARIRNAATKQHTKEMLLEAFDRLRSIGLLNDGCRTKVKLCRNDVLTIALPSNRGYPLPFRAMQAVAYSDVIRRNDAARVYGMDPTTVTRMRNLVAHVQTVGDNGYMDCLGETWKRKAPLVLVCGMAADCTKHTFDLQMVGLDGEVHSTNSSWNVMVSTHRFAWVEDDGDAEWKRIDFVRPNIALVSSESAATLYSTMYSVQQLRSFSNLEISGVSTAVLCMFHWDLDGHPSNIRAVGIRRNTLIDQCGRMPLCSVKHCGNHTNNLIEVSAVGACHPCTYTWLASGSAFFKMGGNFLRIIAAVVVEVDRNLLPQVVSEPPTGCWCYPIVKLWE
jgi:hypothetical protein